MPNVFATFIRKARSVIDGNTRRGIKPEFLGAVVVAEGGWVHCSTLISAKNKYEFHANERSGSVLYGRTHEEDGC